jgi:hypothetical protein
MEGCILEYENTSQRVLIQSRLYKALKENISNMNNKKSEELDLRKTSPMFT